MLELYFLYTQVVFTFEVSTIVMSKLKTPHVVYIEDKHSIFPSKYWSRANAERKGQLPFCCALVSIIHKPGRNERKGATEERQRERPLLPPKKKKNRWRFGLLAIWNGCPPGRRLPRTLQPPLPLPGRYFLGRRRGRGRRGGVQRWLRLTALRRWDTWMLMPKMSRWDSWMLMPKMKRSVATYYTYLYVQNCGLWTSKSNHILLSGTQKEVGRWYLFA